MSLDEPPPHAVTGFAILRLDGEVLYAMRGRACRCAHTSRSAIATPFAARAWTDRSRMRAHLDRAIAEGEAQDEFEVLEDDGGWGRLVLRTRRMDAGPEPLLMVAHVTDADEQQLPDPLHPSADLVEPADPAGSTSMSVGEHGLAAAAEAILADLSAIDGRVEGGAPLDPAELELLIDRLSQLRRRIGRSFPRTPTAAPAPSFDECVRAREGLRRALLLVAELAEDVV